MAPKTPSPWEKAKGTRVGIILTALVCLGLIGLLASGLTNIKVPTAASGATTINQPAPDFSLQLFDGQQMSLGEIRDKIAVINFWASWCGPCREEAAILENIWLEYQDKGVVFIGVNIQDSTSAAENYLEQFHITYPNGPDANGRIAINYGIVGIPVTLFVSKNGVVKTRWVGAITEEILRKEINNLLGFQGGDSANANR